jgi:hypothetical protein
VKFFDHYHLLGFLRPSALFSVWFLPFLIIDSFYGKMHSWRENNSKATLGSWLIPPILGDNFLCVSSQLFYSKYKT